MCIFVVVVCFCFGFCLFVCLFLCVCLLGCLFVCLVCCLVVWLFVCVLCFHFFNKPSRLMEVNVSVPLTDQQSNNKMVLEPNVSPHKQIIKDDDVKECISIKYVENQKVSFFTFTIM